VQAPEVGPDRNYFKARAMLAVLTIKVANEA
jgi:hypothetical protein